MPNYIWAFLLALVVALIATPLVIELAAKTGAMDAPDARKVHKGPMPRIGGLAIYVGFMAAMAFMLDFAQLPAEIARGMVGLLLGATIIVIIGLIDDYKNLPAKVKLLGQIFAACVLVAFDIRIEWVNNPFGGYFYLNEWFISVPLTIFWVISFTNVVNLIDGLDGKLKRPYNEVGSFETSALIDPTSDTLVTAGTNGMLYVTKLGTEFDYNVGSIKLDPSTVVLKSKATGEKNKNTAVESSIAMYQSYAFYADVKGILRCVDTTTMSTVWAVNTEDEVDAAISLDFDDNGTLWLYTANTLTNRSKGNCQIRRYNAMTGELDWTSEVAVKKNTKNTVTPGAKASAVIGENDIDDLVIYTLSGLQTDAGVTITGADGAAAGAVIALNKTDGSVAWTRALDDYSYSSPVAVYSEDGESWIVQASASGMLYLLKGTTGEVVSTLQLEGTIEGSPAVYGSTLVIGTTGKNTAFIYGITLE